MDLAIYPAHRIDVALMDGRLQPVPVFTHCRSGLPRVEHPLIILLRPLYRGNAHTGTLVMPAQHIEPVTHTFGRMNIACILHRIGEQLPLTQAAIGLNLCPLDAVQQLAAKTTHGIEIAINMHDMHTAPGNIEPALFQVPCADSAIRVDLCPLD